MNTNNTNKTNNTIINTRGIAPAIGKLAHLGGFVEEEDVFEAAARECQEESGLVLDVKLFRPFHFVSSHPKPNRVLLFSLYTRPLEMHQVEVLKPTAEMTAFRVVSEEDNLEEMFAFPLHAVAARKYFATHHQ